jgi:hypothetical protein
MNVFTNKRGMEELENSEETYNEELPNKKQKRVIPKKTPKKTPNETLHRKKKFEPVPRFKTYEDIRVDEERRKEIMNLQQMNNYNYNPINDFQDGYNNLAKQIEFVNNLEEPRKNALLQYIQSSNVCVRINKELRTNTVSNGIFQKPETTTYIEIIDSIFNDIPETETYIEVYRCFREGINQPRFNANIDNRKYFLPENIHLSKDTRTIHVSQYLSTTLHYGFAEGFCRDNFVDEQYLRNKHELSTIIKIIIPIKTKVIPLYGLDMSEYKNEFEVLLPRSGELYALTPINQTQNQSGLSLNQFNEYIDTHKNTYIFVQKPIYPANSLYSNLNGAFNGALSVLAGGHKTKRHQTRHRHKSKKHYNSSKKR